MMMITAYVRMVVMVVVVMPCIIMMVAIVVWTMPIPVVVGVITPAPCKTIAAVVIRTIIPGWIPPSIAKVYAYAPICRIVVVPIHIGIIVVEITNSYHRSVKTTYPCGICIIVIVIIAVNYCCDAFNGFLLRLFAIKFYRNIFLFCRVGHLGLFLHTSIV